MESFSRSGWICEIKEKNEDMSVYLQRSCCRWIVWEEQLFLFGILSHARATKTQIFRRKFQKLRILSERCDTEIFYRRDTILVYRVHSCTGAVYVQGYKGVVQTWHKRCHATAAVMQILAHQHTAIPKGVSKFKMPVRMVERPLGKTACWISNHV